MRLQGGGMMEEEEEQVGMEDSHGEETELEEEEVESVEAVSARAQDASQDVAGRRRASGEGVSLRRGGNIRWDGGRWRRDERGRGG